MAEKQDVILTVGSGSAETVLTSEHPIRIGQKHITRRHELLGGSGLNFSFRLIHAGFPALPCLSIGEDRTGHIIRETFLQSLKTTQPNRQFIERIESEQFFCPGLATAHTTIVVSRDTRSIFTEKMQNAGMFREHFYRQIEQLSADPAINIRAVLIGHIYADHPMNNPENPGEITRFLIDEFSEKALVYVNPGLSQFISGASFWESYLPQMGVFQVSLSEIRQFFEATPDVNSLEDILHWLAARHITAVITLDKFGAIGTFQDGSDGLIFAWPFELENIIDSTGAGDAFAAGFTATLYQQQSIDFSAFRAAIQTATIWGAYACTTLGGAQDCPDRQTLENFAKEINAFDSENIEIKSTHDADLILRLLDKAY